MLPSAPRSWTRRSTPRKDLLRKVIAIVRRTATRIAARGVSGVSSTVRRKAVVAVGAGVASAARVVPMARADPAARAAALVVAAAASWVPV